MGVSGSAALLRGARCRRGPPDSLLMPRRTLGRIVRGFRRPGQFVERSPSSLRCGHPVPRPVRAPPQAAPIAPRSALRFGGAQFGKAERSRIESFVIVSSADQTAPGVVVRQMIRCPGGVITPKVSNCPGAPRLAAGRKGDSRRAPDLCTGKPTPISVQVSVRHYQSRIRRSGRSAIGLDCRVPPEWLLVRRTEWLHPVSTRATSGHQCRANSNRSEVDRAPDSTTNNTRE